MKKIILMLVTFAFCFCIFAGEEEFMKNYENKRIENFFGKIKRGEPVTVVALGGSITTGFAAKTPSQEGWAGLTGKWLKELAQKNNSELSFYNRGVSGTDSAFAIARLKEHVISLKPDLVLLEFAMNDQWLEAKVREDTYEGIIRNLMNNNETAIFALFVNERKAPYPSAQNVQQPICDYYKIPYVSWKDCVEKNETLASFENYFDGEETVHPNNNGHENIAKYIQQKLSEIYEKSLADSIYPIKELPSPKGSGRFENSIYYHKDNIKPCENSGWTAGTPVHNEWTSHGSAKQGWQTNVVDAEIIFDIEASSIGVTYCESDQFRNAVAWVENSDGSIGQKINLACYVSYRKGYFGWAYKELVNSSEIKKYRVHIQCSRRASKSQEGKYCNITGILVTQ